MKTKTIELTEEQYNTLKEFDRHLTTAFKARYVTAIYTSTAMKLFDIYNEVYGTNKKATTCMNCVLEVCMKLGKLYFEHQEKQKTAEAEQEPAKGKKSSQRGKKTTKNKTVKKQDNGEDNRGTDTELGSEDA